MVKSVKKKSLLMDIDDLSKIKKKCNKITKVILTKPILSKVKQKKENNYKKGHNIGKRRVSNLINSYKESNLTLTFGESYFSKIKKHYRNLNYNKPVNDISLDLKIGANKSHIQSDQNDNISKSSIKLVIDNVKKSRNKSDSKVKIIKYKVSSNNNQELDVNNVIIKKTKRMASLNANAIRKAILFSNYNYSKKINDSCEKTETLKIEKNKQNQISKSSIIRVSNNYSNQKEIHYSHPENIKKSISTKYTNNLNIFSKALIPKKSSAKKCGTNYERYSSSCSYTNLKKKLDVDFLRTKFRKSMDYIDLNFKSLQKPEITKFVSKKSSEIKIKRLASLNASAILSASLEKIKYNKPKCNKITNLKKSFLPDSEKLTIVKHEEIKDKILNEKLITYSQNTTKKLARRKPNRESVKRIIPITIGSTISNLKSNFTSTENIAKLMYFSTNNTNSISSTPTYINNSNFFNARNIQYQNQRFVSFSQDQKRLFSPFVLDPHSHMNAPKVYDLVVPQLVFGASQPHYNLQLCQAPMSYYENSFSQTSQYCCRPYLAPSQTLFQSPNIVLDNLQCFTSNIFNSNSFSSPVDISKIKTDMEKVDSDHDTPISIFQASGSTNYFSPKINNTLFQSNTNNCITSKIHESKPLPLILPKPKDPKVLSKILPKQIILKGNEKSIDNKKSSILSTVTAQNNSFMISELTNKNIEDLSQFLPSESILELTDKESITKQLKRKSKSFDLSNIVAENMKAKILIDEVGFKNQSNNITSNVKVDNISADFLHVKTSPEQNTEIDNQQAKELSLKLSEMSLTNLHTAVQNVTSQQKIIKENVRKIKTVKRVILNCFKKKLGSSKVKKKVKRYCNALQVIKADESISNKADVMIKPKIKDLNLDNNVNEVRKSGFYPAGFWNWEGLPHLKYVSTKMDDSAVMMPCYSVIRHSCGDIVSVRDCVLVKSGMKKKDIPYVAKIHSLWQDPITNEMMMSVFWYYRREHLECGSFSLNKYIDSEIFASRHRDIIPIACIEDVCHVLTLAQFARYKAMQKKLSQEIVTNRDLVIGDDEAHSSTKLMRCMRADAANVFLCRYIYDYKIHRVIKNPNINLPLV